MMPDHQTTDRPIALVTGASRGIGRAAAVALGRAGYQVVAVGRAQQALEATDDAIQAQGGAPATLVPLDITDFDGLDRLGGALFQRHGRLDVLVHAAARLGELTPAFHQTPANGERMINTNFTATWRLIRALQPLLMVPGNARALFFTSGVVAAPRANWGLYAATKAATEALVASWVQEVAFKGVGAVTLNPGPVATAMRKQAFPGEDPATLPPPEALSSCMLELVSQAGPARKGEVVNFRDTPHFAAWEAARA
jgi:NAD(P)-dependent dehydrogenase (short-subunit alcohol dehydrogenase family)